MSDSENSWGALGEDPRVVFQDESVILLCARWQDVDLPASVDAFIEDPPFSERTHKGQRTGSELRMPTIGYDGIERHDAKAMAVAAVESNPSWAVTFSDHIGHVWHENAWQSLGWVTFAPVFLKSNPPPRYSGDGPGFALEFLMVARPRKVTRCGSLPAIYEYQVGGGRALRTVAGAKPLELMRALVRDWKSVV